MTRPFHLGLIGWPVSHSLSPLLHQAALQAAGLSGDYRLLPVPPLPAGEPALHAALADLRSGRLAGLNVTLPHKQAVLPLLDALTPAAQAIGAANTLFVSAGRLIGDNTDAPGFAAALHRAFPARFDRPAGQLALVLGAGGSARAVVHALCAAGFDLAIAARRLEQARALAAALAPSAACLPLAAPDLAGLCALHPPALVVQTTPLGMHPHPDVSPWPVDLPLPPAACLFDLIYRPTATRLVRQALAAGLPASGGLEMLIEQAALSFECWTAHPADRAAMRAALTPSLEATTP